MAQTYAWFLARLAKQMSWKDVTEAFQSSWENIFRSLKKAVEWGRQPMDLDGITAIGIDELQ